MALSVSSLSLSSRFLGLIEEMNDKCKVVRVYLFFIIYSSDLTEPVAELEEDRLNRANGFVEYRVRLRRPRPIYNEKHMFFLV